VRLGDLKKPIVLVFGRLCSGKGTYCKQYTDRGYHHVTTSDVVKSLSGKSRRDQLQKTKSLDQAIAEKLSEVASNNQPIVIDGIRQVSIVDYLVNTFGKDNIEMVWLEVPKDIRRNRYNKRGSKGDVAPFDKAEAGDSELGLDDVEAKYKSRSKIINHY
jgi:dephospho-CoA kinase